LVVLRSQKEVPQPEPNSEPAAVPPAAALWAEGGTRQSGSTDEDIVIKMNSLTSCIESKARFLQAQNHVDQPLIIEVHIRLAEETPMEFGLEWLVILFLRF